MEPVIAVVLEAVPLGVTSRTELARAGLGG
jgi:hypothetical protein